jgi:hypothetical protein
LHTGVSCDCRVILRRTIGTAEQNVPSLGLTKNKLGLIHTGILDKAVPIVNPFGMLKKDKFMPENYFGRRSGAISVLIAGGAKCVKFLSLTLNFVWLQIVIVSCNNLPSSFPMKAQGRQKSWSAIK